MRTLKSVSFLDELQLPNKVAKSVGLGAHRIVRTGTGGSSRLQREGPKPANADTLQAHQVYIVGHNHKVRFRKGGPNRILHSRSEFCPVAPPLDPPVRTGTE